MSVEGWIVFAVFWVVFVTTPGPNAVNCMSNGMTYGFRKSLWGVLAILTQATLFLLLSAAGVTALLASSPKLFIVGKLIGAVVLLAMGIRGWILARRLAPDIADPTGGGIYMRAFLIATINVKSVLGYLAAFTQFVQIDVPVWKQMSVIMPTALVITSISYCGYTALGAGLGRAAIGAMFNVWLRRAMDAFFILYGVMMIAAVSGMM
jgi:threonine/homoserine/homoserine lactone efflux protein